MPTTIGVLANLALLLSGLLAVAEGATFELFELPSQTYPDAICNDGTRAGFYHDTDLSKLSKVHVHLEGGNLCDSDEACVDRCDQDHDGQVDNGLCTGPVKQTIEKQSGLFSDDEANPLRDYWHVIVPYCSSDTWAGTGYSQGSGYSYHGKYIFRNVMNSLSHHYNLFEATDFVLSGSSAGGFGVGLNCDDVAEWLHGESNNPGVNVKCVADAPDFIPWWAHSEDCPRREAEYQEFVNSYWSRDMDHSCQDFAFDPANNVSNPWELCGMLSKSLPFVESDMFVMVSLRDTVISRDYGCPEPGLEDEVFVPWRAGMHGLISANNVNNPRVGWFSPSCEVHGISGLIQNMTVPDVYTGERMSSYAALARWMEGEVVHAVDGLEEDNLTCP